MYTPTSLGERLGVSSGCICFCAYSPSAKMSLTPSPLVDKFLSFINQSPTPFHAVSNAIKRLEGAGFDRLKEREEWKGKLKKGGKYYVTRYSTSYLCLEHFIFARSPTILSPSLKLIDHFFFFFSFYQKSKLYWLSGFLLLFLAMKICGRPQ